MGMATTIYDVATAAGVSSATVSRALNHPEMVAASTREKVLVAVESLGFEPMLEAMARARKGPQRVGVIGPFGTHDAARRRLAGILLEAGGDVDVVVYNATSAEATAAPLLATLPLTGRLDGLIIVSLPLDPQTSRRLAARDHPTVLVDVADDAFTSIRTDDTNGGVLVADHLVDLGHQWFGFFGEAQCVARPASPSSRRLHGFRTALRARDLATGGSDLREVYARIEDASDAARRILGGTERPTAVFASDDLRATALVLAAAEAGLRVPQDLSVVGFDDGDLAQAMSLSTVHQPIEESGRMALRRLRDQLAGERSVSRVLARVRLVARNSSAAAPTPT